MTNSEMAAVGSERSEFLTTPVGRAMEALVSAVRRSERAEAAQALSSRRLDELADNLQMAEQNLIIEIKKLQPNNA